MSIECDSAFIAVVPFVVLLWVVLLVGALEVPGWLVVAGVSVCACGEV